MTVENASVTDLGGGAPVGAEPDLFDEGAADAGESQSDADAGAAADADAGGEETSGSEDTSSDAGAGEGDSEEGADASSEEGAEGAEGEAAAEGEDGKAAAEAAKGAKTPEQIAAEKAAAAKKPLTEEEKEIERTLTEAYRDHPKLKEVFKNNPELRAPFFKAAQINKLYPTIREAEQAKEWSMALFNIDKLYYGKSIEDTKALQKMLWEENLNKDGVSAGAYERLQEAFTSDSLSGLERVLTQNPNLANLVQTGFKPEQAAVAIEVVRRLIAAANGRPLGAGSGIDTSKGGKPAAGAESLPDTTNMTPREKQLAEELSRYRAQDATRQTEEQSRLEQSFNTNAFKLFWDGDSAQSISGVKSEVDKRIPAAYKGNEFLENAFRDRALNEIHKALQADEFFNSQLEAAKRSGDRGPEHTAEIADMLRQRAVLLVPSITRQIAQQAQAKAAVAGAGSSGGANRGRGNERPRREPATGGTPGRLTKPAEKGSPTAARQSAMKTTGDYSRDADRILGID